MGPWSERIITTTPEAKRYIVFVKRLTAAAVITAVSVIGIAPAASAAKAPKASDTSTVKTVKAPSNDFQNRIDWD